MKRYAAFLIISIVAFGCENQTESSLDEILSVPAHFPAIVHPKNNAPSELVIDLGKKLFFDPRLSGNNQVACGSCHFQELAFADSVPFSQGANGKTLRNTQPIFNLAFKQEFFWDGGATSLERQIFGPLENHAEMGQELFELMRELKADKDYPELFDKAFNSGGINSNNIAKALAQFQRSIISSNSKYDKWLAGDENALNQLEKQGHELVKAKCGSCHSGVLFTDESYHNTGLDSTWNSDSNLNVLKGRYRISNDFADIGAFKTPTLRNLKFTAPYMHDGRFKNLDQVLNHYTAGVKDSEYLDDMLEANNPIIVEEDKAAILAFLYVLNDEELVRDEKYRP
ncbi:MAG: cytochrome-c peroxidase [Bacteroidetes bacterium]|nr:cytochrome-c peroxidase [Bacteroidota bacterium]